MLSMVGMEAMKTMMTAAAMMTMVTMVGMDALMALRLNVLFVHACMLMVQESYILVGVMVMVGRTGMVVVVMGKRNAMGRALMGAYYVTLVVLGESCTWSTLCKRPNTP